MDTDGEICAFLINSKYICFNCYDPDQDKNKEDEILTADILAEKNQYFCSRCKGLMIPDRRSTNRRKNEERRYLDATVLAPDQRDRKDRRSGKDRRKFS